MEKEKVLGGEIEEFIASITLGEAKNVKNLSIFPVFSERIADDGYMLLEEALQTNKVFVEEVSDGGNVPEVFVKNELTDTDLLLLQGDILSGAKQTRTITASIVVPRMHSLKVNVSCVESGRWRYTSKNFSSSKHYLYASLRKKSSSDVNRNLRASKGSSYECDQSAVWEDIREKSSRLKSASPTESIEDIYTSYEEEMKNYESSFKALPGQIGYVTAINGKMIGFEVFGSRSILPKVYGKLLKGYILDAIDVERTEKQKGQSPKGHSLKGTSGARKFIEKTTTMRQEKYKSQGAGEEIRLENKDATGFALVSDEKKLVHMAVFA